VDPQAPEPEALLNATIFFDFRSLYGNETLASEPERQWLLAHDRARQALFLRFMAGKCRPDRRRLLGFIREFTFDKNPDFPHTLDLKASGARLFVDAARIIALAHGIPHSSTVERLRAAAARQAAGRRRHQRHDRGLFHHPAAAPAQPARRHGARRREPVDPDKLNELDRLVLKEAFKQAKRLQSRLQLEYRRKVT
jgi:CBS domain-containing protein